MSYLFEDVARDLFHNRSLRIGNQKYEFVEIEFYVHSEGHPDATAHQHPDQQTFGNWYFHRTSAKSEAKYKGGTFKGLDLTLGEDGVCYGILIRSIYSPETKAICGPCKVVDHILKTLGVSSIQNLTQNQLLNVEDNKVGLILQKDNIPEGDVYFGSRIGLSNVEWKDKPYRFARRYKDAKGMKAKTSMIKI